MLFSIAEQESAAARSVGPIARLLIVKYVAQVATCALLFSIGRGVGCWLVHETMAGSELPPLEQYLSSKQAAKLGVSEHILRLLGIHYLKFGKAVRYDPALSAQGTREYTAYRSFNQPCGGKMDAAGLLQLLFSGRGRISSLDAYLEFVGENANAWARNARPISGDGRVVT
jgi:hypothetical protein